MKAEGLLAHYARIADAPDAIAKLRRLVLDLAVRGKLVLQDAGEETASKLLARISLDVGRTGGRYKRDGNEAHVGRGPFDLPTSWTWTTLGAIARYGNPAKVNSSIELTESTWVLDLEDIEKNTGRLSQRMESIARPFQSSKTRFAAGDVLFGKLRPYLRKVLVASEPGVCTTEIVPISPAEGVNPRFLELVLRSPLTMSKVDQLMYGVKMPRLGTSDANRLLFPLPPSEEQRRIVAKVDELMALCDQLEAARVQREATRDRLAAASLARLNTPDPDTFHADARFALDALPTLTTRPDQIKQLRQTILNLAVRGRLVPQDPNDMRCGGEKHVSESRPGEIPSTWAYCALEDLLAEDTRNGYSRRPDDDPAGSPILRISAGTARVDGVVAEEEHKLISGIDDAARRQYGLRPGDLLACRFNGNRAYVGRLTIFEDYLGLEPIYPDKLIRIRVSEKSACPRYIRLAGEADLVRAEIEAACATTVGNWGISATNLKKVRFPVPPLAEQIRIVAKVDELMTLCDQLEASLTAGETTRRRLLDALLHEALATAAEASSEHPRAAVPEYTTAGDKECFVG